MSTPGTHTDTDGVRLLTTREAGQMLPVVARRMGVKEPHLLRPVSASRIRQFYLAGRLPGRIEGRDLWIREDDLELIADRGRGRPSGDDWKGGSQGGSGRKRRASARPPAALPAPTEEEAAEHAARLGVSRPAGASWLVPSAVGSSAPDRQRRP